MADYMSVFFRNAASGVFCGPAAGGLFLLGLITVGHAVMS